MTTKAPQSEQIQYLPPKGDYETFRDEDHLKEKLKEWGLSAGKREFWYKDRSFQQLVSIQGFEAYGKAGEFNTVIIKFPDGKLSSIHPAFLKEMQQSSFGKESLITAEDPGKKGVQETADVEPEEEAATHKSKLKPEPKTVQDQKNAESNPESEATEDQKNAESKKIKGSKKAKPAKLDLPADKVHFTASVKQFALTYNPFNEENDEVVVLENVQIVQENPLDLGLAWCSHSKTLKKFELTPGDLLEFDGKVVAKKLAKGKDVENEFQVEAPVLYKINNPSKIVKK